MDLLISQVVLKTTDIAAFLKTDKKNVSDWCNLGKLRAKRDKETGKWQVKVDAFIDFLYYNPYHLDIFKAYTPDKRKILLVKNFILEKLSLRPHIYTRKEIRKIFDVSDETVIGWIRRKVLIPLDIRTTDRAYNFNEASIRKVLETYPHYTILFEHYKEEHKL